MDHDVVSAIYRAYEEAGAKEDPRPYLGASLLGKPCTRAIWYEFRWASRTGFSGRMLRLFEYGHQSEARFLKNLRDIGATVFGFDPDTGRQFGYSDLYGHLRGHTDGAGKDIPGGDGEWHLLEFKTHSAKSFAKLHKFGVEGAKPEHWVQMTMYMGWSELEVALYLAENKDTDELYAERVPFDRDLFESMRNRASQIIFDDTPPLGISDDPNHYLCRFCDHKEICFGNRVPKMSCRTCVHSTPEKDGDARWSCARHKKDISPAEQLLACEAHLPFPHLVQYGDPIDAGDNYIEFVHKDTGVQFIVVNDLTDRAEYRDDTYVYYSEEISNAHRGVITNADHEEMRKLAGGRITG